MVAAGTIDVGIACGVESMSRIPLGGNVPPGLGRPAPRRLGHRPAQPVRGRRPDRRNRGLTREDLDAFGLASQQKARVAVDEGRFKREIAPLTAPVLDEEGKPTGETRSSTPTRACATPRSRAWPASSRCCPTACTPPARRRRSPTAPSAVLIMDEDKARALGLTPRARIKTHCLVGSDPYYHLDGPIEATQKLLDRTGMAISDFDLFEVNEAFASVVLSWAGQHGVDMDKVNVNGGAIALGHPVGSTGTRLITTALHELERRDASTALISMCAGGAMATGTIIERI